MTLHFGDRLHYPRRTAAAENMKSAEAGSKEVFLQLLLPVKKHLYNFVQKALNFSDEADDVFQETLLKGYRYFHSFDRGKSFKTWIFTIAHNLIKDFFSSRDLVLLEDVETIPSEQESVMPEDVRAIYAAAAKLKPRHREVFFLYYYNEFSVAEIVEITDLSKANVKFILHRARKSVKQILEVAT